MTLHDIIREIAAEIPLKQGMTREVVWRFLDKVSAALVKDGRANLGTLGTFAVKVRKARTARNPRTKLPMLIPEKKVIKFRPGKGLKDRVNPPPPAPTQSDQPPAPSTPS